MSYSGREAVAQYLDDLLTVNFDLAEHRAGQGEDSPATVPGKPIVGSSRHEQLALVRRATAVNTSAHSRVTGLEESTKHKLQALFDDHFDLLPEPVAAPEVPTVLVGAVELAAPTSSVFISNLDWVENGRPAWAQRSFDVLLLRVAGLTIAVPLLALGHIYSLSEGLNRLPGQASCYMGVFSSACGPIKTLNTAQFVMPERYDPKFLLSAKYVVTIDSQNGGSNHSWGLAVDAIKQPISLSPEEVNWRQARSKHPWLAGIVKTQMCVLLDIPQLSQMLLHKEATKCCS